MRRVQAWVPPFLLAVLVLGLRAFEGGAAPSPLLALGARVAAFGLLAFLFDHAARHSRHDVPMYRRHFWIFLGLALFGAACEAHGGLGWKAPAEAWLADLLGSVLGLTAAVWPFLAGSRQPTYGWWRGRRERPDPARPLILVADPHWGEELTGLPELTRRYPEADWLFLGDLFDVWVALPGLENESQRSFLWWVQERREARRWIGLWAGNRDFFLDGLSRHFDLLGEGTGGSLPAEGLAFEHGDLVNASDRRYRLWNVVSRSAFTWVLVSLLPPVLARRLAARLERTMRTTNRAYRLSFPREAFAAAAATQAEPVYLTGHFHTHETEGKGIALPWAHEGAFALWQEGRIEFLPAPIRPEATFFKMRRP